MVGVSLEEADRRIALQGAIGELGATLETQEAAAFGGLYIEHTPTFRAVAEFTSGATEALQRHVSGTQLEGLVETQQVAYTWLELNMELDSIRRDLGEGSYALDIDTRQNRVEVEVTSLSAFFSLHHARDFELPASAVVVVVDALPTAALDLQAGLGSNARLLTHP
jgi:hypothetical protein